MSSPARKFPITISLKFDEESWRLQVQTPDHRQVHASLDHATLLREHVGNGKGEDGSENQGMKMESSHITRATRKNPNCPRETNQKEKPYFTSKFASTVAPSLTSTSISTAFLPIAFLAATGCQTKSLCFPAGTSLISNVPSAPLVA